MKFLILLLHNLCNPELLHNCQYIVNDIMFAVLIVYIIENVFWLVLAFALIHTKAAFPFLFPTFYSFLFLFFIQLIFDSIVLKRWIYSYIANKSTVMDRLDLCLGIKISTLLWKCCFIYCMISCFVLLCFV
jgi:hypothetical protein